MLDGVGLTSDWAVEEKISSTAKVELGIIVLTG